MNLRETRATEERRTQAAPVSLEHGRFEPGQVVQLWLVSGGGIGAGAFGGLLVSWGLAAADSSWGWLAGLGMWLAIFGVLLTILSWVMALAAVVLGAAGWWLHLHRVQDWHFAQLAAYEAAGGQESRREVAQRTLTTTEPAHALLVALHIVQQVREGVRTPWSSTNLQGDIWYNGVRLGTLTKPEAEAFSRLFAEVGAVTGRRKGVAGQLTVADESELLQLVARNYGKYVPGRVERAELPAEE